jgi:tripartite-type tricarboxylate transporter receptor subunit TctC
MKRPMPLKAMGMSLALPAMHGFAQGLSGRPLQLMVPLPRGTSNDTSARLIAAGLSPL